MFGTEPCTSVTSDSTTVYGRTPAGSGTVQVKFTLPDEVTQYSDNFLIFEYLSIPTIDNIIPQ